VNRRGPAYYKQDIDRIYNYPTYNTQAAVGKPESPRMAPSKWTWPRVYKQDTMIKYTTTATTTTIMSSHAAEPLTTTTPPQHQSAAPTM